MDKNWLIRTKSNHILGPVSKEKVVELYHNGSIKPDDEVCSGNGYWFFVREDDLVNRFLLGPETQSFNPISEAKNVLTKIENEVPKEDLENDITLVGGITMAMLKEEDAPQVSIPPAPEGTKVLDPVKKSQNESATSKKKTRLEEKVRARKPYSPPQQQNWIKYLGIIGFLVLFLLIYFRKTIIQNFFSEDFVRIEFRIIPIANAQEEIPEKKKSFLNQK